MTRVKLMELISRAIRRNVMTDADLDSFRTSVQCDGKIYIVYLAGNDEMFTLDGKFYQIGIDPINDRIYKFFFFFDDIDYTKAYCMEEIDGPLKKLLMIEPQESEDKE